LTPLGLAGTEAGSINNSGWDDLINAAYNAADHAKEYGPSVAGMSDHRSLFA